ncbi:MAG: RNase A-like domain-containing protein [Nocardioides sp.]
MRLAVDGGGYATAVRSLTEGNHLAAMTHERLRRALAGCSTAMAGDDTSSAAFAGSYDPAARDTLAAVADAVGAFAGLARLARVSAFNHATAEARSVISPGSVYDGGSLPAGDCVEVLASTPPTSLGADTAGLPAHLSVVVDHLQGFVWPSADPARLRAAGSAWRHAGSGLDGLGRCCDEAADGLWQELSPEVPVAVETLRDLRCTVHDLASQAYALAAACTAYADEVETRREEILHVAEWLLEQVVEGVLIGVALGVLTGGSGAAASMAAVVARVAAESPRFVRIFEALVTLARTTAEGVGFARESVIAARARLVRLSVARGERGAFQALPERPGDWLTSMERAGGHTISKHVGKSREWLIDRMAREGKRRASTFADAASAESAVRAVLAHNREGIARFVASSRHKEAFSAVLDHSSGIVMTPDGIAHQVSGVRVVLVRAPGSPEGYLVRSAFPDIVAP